MALLRTGDQLAGQSVIWVGNPTVTHSGGFAAGVTTQGLGDPVSHIWGTHEGAPPDVLRTEHTFGVLGWPEATADIKKMAKWERQIVPTFWRITRVAPVRSPVVPPNIEVYRITARNASENLTKEQAKLANTNF